jgi:DNA replicative helicase MCM subunit Mcm2 (Cdc46/Mcm family)|tara:strand:+ start:1800 stop:2012 length:213 start_codon:yes stop_codon:yes gene_type:complete
VTPRTLLAFIRISQAMAKFHFRNFVEQADVDQAIKLIDYSFRTLEEMKGERTENRMFSKYLILIFDLILF